MLDRAHAGELELFTSALLLAELEDVLRRDKLARRLRLARVTAQEIVMGYASIARTIHVPSIAPVIESDPDDDAVFACAVAAQAEVIVSGDHHLLEIRSHRQIRVLTPAELLALLSS